MAQLTKDDIHRAQILVKVSGYSVETVALNAMQHGERLDEIGFMMMGLGLELGAHMHPEEAAVWAAAFRKANSITGGREYDQEKVDKASQLSAGMVQHLRDQLADNDHEGDCSPTEAAHRN